LAFVGEVIDPERAGRTLELVFLADVSGRDAESLGPGEPGTTPTWVPAEELSGLHLRPPIAGYLPALLRGRRGTAPYLGNLWRASRDIDRTEDTP
jgi:8-oxo-dGTP diphosphatase